MPFFRRSDDTSLAKDLNAIADKQAGGEIVRVDIAAIEARLATDRRLAKRDQPLVPAIRLRDLALVRLLIQSGADHRIRVRQKRSLLHLAAEAGHPEIVRLIVERGIAVDIRDRYRRTPLMVAAGEGQADAAFLLLELGADIDARDVIGGKATEWAVFWHHFDLAREMLAIAGKDGAPAWGTSDVELAVLACEDAHAYRLARGRLAGDDNHDRA
jgi:ankyrin repeat protein